MGERAGRPCVGEPGKLSLDDSERFNDDSERLVCSKFDCFVILRKRELRFLLEDKEGTSFPGPDSRSPGSSHFRAAGTSWNHPPNLDPPSSKTTLLETGDFLYGCPTWLLPPGLPIPC